MSVGSSKIVSTKKGKTMDKREQEFWNYYNPIQELADKHDTSVYTIVNFRQIFDYAYACGKADGATEMMEIYKEGN
jgi:hypothetical protein